MSERKSAYTATIERIDDIENKDLIKYVKLVDNGFQIIHNIQGVPIKVGEKVVYIEYDTIIEPCSEFEFLRKRCYSEKWRGFHLRAMKMGGVVSYGLIIDIANAQNIIADRIVIGKFKPPMFTNIYNNIGELSDGVDLSEALGIKAIDDAEDFEPKTERKPVTKFERFLKKNLYFLWKAFFYRKPFDNSFPTMVVSKSDETRIETLQYMFNPEFKETPVYTTVKMDGQSFTALIYKKRFYICSRNITKYNQPLAKAIKELIPSNEGKIKKNDPFVIMACKKSLAKKMNDYWSGHDYAIQAELCGPGIQKNRIGLTENNIFVYNYYLCNEKQYYGWPMIVELCQHLNLDTVPFVENRLWDFVDTAAVKEYSRGVYQNGLPREGVVIRAVSNDTPFIPSPHKEQHGCFSLKCINPDFDAKYNAN